MAGPKKGTGGKGRRRLTGRGPTPKAEDRTYHKAYRAKQDQGPRKGTRPSHGAKPSSTGRGAAPDWVVGRNPVLEALQANLPVRRAYVAEGSEHDDRLREIFKYAAEHSLSLLQVPRQELDKLTDGAVHQGVALQLPPYEYADIDEVATKALGRDDNHGLLVACDGITDPHNLGAIIRSAAAFGADGVIIPERRSASLTASAWKASAGAAARLRVAKVTNLNRGLERLAKAGFVVAGLAGEADTDIAGIPGVNGPLVLVVGSEGAGLSRMVREHCDVLVSIPITSEVESLNASVATAIALYEVSRARG
ncbi:23S rRNA (guanosine(2251)-2'-O)-methyltransferase RlmB [Propionibacterium freudenreichii]|uniref:RNA methyltransferase, TrmH family, group 3 n=2 Tax=Propionibacterium freudenreichii TaxID=1744 RepID=A0A2C7AP39_9ACTN|nr:23S rRNA (guanosine(2251)-2'-O)-methyltransferase RlmB [Propionibacterium freudenreichii]AJQ91481.1 RNA methyltransferase, TrmH family, group 3 [Propionibacterium freudenreichii subsp. freudenreichii]MCT2976248.1 23S rRNA (guanosine(2251)-2'-O)-methyltransferase RlmB [Propionibacterium freudenreichii]MCT2978114.1 23S rRNA (guanosine(2251)-2'-O)-methyltransferase RlmB [Propionibacterium freudenreichii]MCT2984185.1 23S rRNA (guanosine(2251)-2'-O)-methyltransferase RlmB [Propionibacterium freud